MASFLLCHVLILSTYYDYSYKNSFNITHRLFLVIIYGISSYNVVLNIKGSIRLKLIKHPVWSVLILDQTPFQGAENWIALPQKNGYVSMVTSRSWDNNILQSNYPQNSILKWGCSIWYAKLQYKGHTACLCGFCSNWITGICHL